jgi:carbamoyltransferase
MSHEPWILGISCSHNGAVCLLHGDAVVVAIQEERVSRLKRRRISGSRPSAAVRRCLEVASIRAEDLSLIVLSVAGMASEPEHDLSLNPDLRDAIRSVPVIVVPHHLAHAASAFGLSGFADAAVLVVDGIGSPSTDLSEEERRAVVFGPADGWESISLYAASIDGVRPIAKQLVAGDRWIQPRTGMPGFGTLGGMFAAAALQIFDDTMEAGKVMGLAPYGTPVHAAEDLLTVENGCVTFHDTVPGRFLHTDRWPNRQLEYQNLAASVQAALEVALLDIVSVLARECPSENFCYAGGVALNSVANERIIRGSRFSDAFIVPAAEDSGAAVGAAYYGLWQLMGRHRTRRLVHDAVGPRYKQGEIAAAIARAPAIEAVASGDVISDTADLLRAGNIVGWFEGRSELGPRALGQRSILCDPRPADAKAVINGRVKHREAFRPFAPAILREEAVNWFHLEETSIDSPFMLRVCEFREDKQALVPSVVHVDGTGRVQTVTREANGAFYDLIRAFHKKTGVPILLNTSFNTMGEPIVETPGDALFSLLNSDLDFCVLGSSLVKARSRGGFQSLTRMVEQIGAVKKAWRASTRDPRTLDATLSEICRLASAGIEAYRAEVLAALGWIPADLEAQTVAEFLDEMLIRPGALEALESGARDLMMTAGFTHCAMAKYPRQAKDWSAIAVTLIAAAERELNAKLVAPLVRSMAARPLTAFLAPQADFARALAAARAGEALPSIPLAAVRRLKGSEGSPAAGLVPGFLGLRSGPDATARLLPFWTLLEKIESVAIAALTQESVERSQVGELSRHLAMLFAGLNDMWTTVNSGQVAR